MRYEHGFTLIELLLTLSSITLILSISGAFTLKTVDQIQFNNFIEQWNRNLLYLQQANMTSTEKYAIYFDQTNRRFIVRNGSLGEIKLVQQYPNNWEIETNTLKFPILTSNSGNLNSPGKMKITTLISRYSITCPFGKSRCYYEKNVS
ncbi:hypothetical protein ACFOZ1_12125 [Gracilibacillus marinus]|jgi:competence protein ComGD|uniref:Prepilin-type N-terminal cleavage/methylation domain-containing protein n=1 Tax=Gracilibacillus marinus TaxID=630535 RepID=A0ABV8VXD9_9BACI